jgi:hypothetical protein
VVAGDVAGNAAEGFCDGCGRTTPGNPCPQATVETAIRLNELMNRRPTLTIAPSLL